MYTLYYMPGRANLAPHIVLQETAVPYKLELVDFEKKAQHDPAYLALNPNGKVPTLVGEGLLIYEAAAITMHIADKHGDAGLAPPFASPERAKYYQWMAYLTGSVQEALIEWFHPDYYVEGEQAEAAFKETAEQRLERMWGLVDKALSDAPYLLGDGYSACDAYLFMLTCWQNSLPKPARRWPSVGRFFNTVRRRPAVERTFQAEGIVSWFSFSDD